MRTGIFIIRTTTGTLGVSFEFGSESYAYELREAKIISGILLDAIRCLECPKCHGRAGMFEEKCEACGGMEHC